MASQRSLDALAAAHHALEDLQRHLEPLLDLLQNPDATRHQRALAQAGIALALGTVRFMGSRFLIPKKGKTGKGTTTTTTTTTTNAAQLRSDLNHMRKLLVQVRKKNEEVSESKDGDNKTDAEDSGAAAVTRGGRVDAKDSKPSVEPETAEKKEVATTVDDTTTTKQSTTSPAAKRKESSAARTSTGSVSSKKRRRKK